MGNHNTRITCDMSITDAVASMAEGNPGAWTCMLYMLNNSAPMGIMDIMVFDDMGIYGEQIYKVWNDCCGRNMNILKKTLKAFRNGKFTMEEIHQNLSEEHPQPFV